MTNEIRNQDRKDQAIGRVIRILPYLQIKEIDALVDRLTRSVEDTGSPHATHIDRDFPTRDHARSVASPGKPDVHLSVDRVGQ